MYFIGEQREKLQVFMTDYLDNEQYKLQSCIWVKTEIIKYIALYHFIPQNRF